MKRFIPFFVLPCLLFSCRVDPKIVEPVSLKGLEQVIPEGWPQPIYKLPPSEISEAKFALGRALFYETMLSVNDSVSCGSCHQDFAAFANDDHDVSHGVRDRVGTRNSPGLFNLAWHPSFMHDGGVNHIEVQPLAPIANPLEMDEDINRVMEKLRAEKGYRTMFASAYGTEEINTERMMKAMALFMGLMTSSESKYDRYKQHKENFTAEELRGYTLFVSKCASCHTEPLFSDFAYRNNGLPVDARYKDSGRAHITRLPQDVYKFKTPSLRNIALTAPYMHDGRFETLQECLDFYHAGGTNVTNRDPLLEYGIPLAPSEKSDIIAFLNTLTDHNFVNDKRFSDPNFKR